ncbi:hypothetical protein JKP88DRAFT_248313 [Tribonema minus]|uniref:Uncharacterized protein n=1 Tax=Tribonema minus TaxID=303371 RepID=A0A835YMK0_9STRA|nr:hypothetical protein JKP88DRAFT_248313 [Tribonema minus]
MLRTFGVLKWGKGEDRPQRISTTPIGLRTVLRDSPIEGITVDAMVEKFTAVSDHASKVRVNASLLANYIFIRSLHDDDTLPLADQAFFTACLSCCRSADTRCTTVKQRFAEFSAATGIVAYPSMPGTTRVFENQAQDMATAANTFIDVHFGDRRLTLVKWGLKVMLRSRVTFTQKVFERRIGELCTFILSTRSEMDVMAAIREELQRLGFIGCFDIVEQLCAITVDFYGSDYPSKLRHLLELQELYLADDRLRFDAINRAAYAAFPKLYPEDTNKQARKAMLDEWTFYADPRNTMSPLPINHNTATFVRLCKKSICELFPKLKVCIAAGDPWWFKAIIDPFSSKAGIPRLRHEFNKYARSEHGMFAAMKMVRDGKDIPVPWMIGPSFETDGKQRRLQLITSALDHPGAPGFLHLHEAGYNVSFIDTTLEEVLEKGDGVYNLRHIYTEAGLQGFDGVTVTPMDPGQKLVAAGAHIQGEDWRIENAADIMFGDHPRVTFSGVEWQTKTFTLKSQNAEKLRRRADRPYGQALQQLQGERKNTCDLATFTKYCTTWNATSGAIWAEVLTSQRRGHRFLRFRAIQRAVEEVAERFAPIKGGKEKYGRRIIMFEDGIWKPKKGCPAAPNKKIVRAICQRSATVMIPAAWGTKTCLGCGYENSDGTDYRTRLCTTSPGCLLHPHTPTIEINRDHGAVGVLGVRAVYVISRIWSAYRDWRPVGYNM